MAEILTATLITNPPLDAVLIEQPELEAVLLISANAGGSSPKYDGEYFFIPSEEQQVISTKNQTLAEDIVIDKIPSNYGKITSVAGFIRVT